MSHIDISWSANRTFRKLNPFQEVLLCKAYIPTANNSLHSGCERARSLRCRLCSMLRAVAGVQAIAAAVHPLHRLHLLRPMNGHKKVAVAAPMRPASMKLLALHRLLMLLAGGQ